MTPEEFRRAGHELIDFIADHLDTSAGADGAPNERSVSRRPVQPTVAPGDVRAALPEHPPTERETFDAVMADVERVIVPGITNWQHPGWFAYFPANVSYPSILGELLSAGLGVQGMSWVTSPACTEVETLMLDWMQELLGLPESFRSTSDTGGGVIQGSASEATLVAILSARHRATNGAVNAGGDTTGLVAYATSQSHSSIEKGLRIAGIGTDRMRTVPHDEQFAMRPDALREMIAADLAAGLVPFFVNANHGSTSSMAFDPSAEIGTICREHGIWFHVDGAMAGIAALVPEYRWVNSGIELADSYCTNPHKWMGVNFDCTTYWTGDRASLLGALSILPDYLRSAAAESGAVIDYRDWQIPLGRRFRALKLWFTIRMDGVDAFRERIRRDVQLTQSLATAARADHRFEVVAPHPLNLLCLAARAGNETTDALIERANASGTALFTRTVLDGRSVLRISIGSHTTRSEHVDAAWELLQRSV
ncbi:MAG: pyridoxal-dependent decarboxylase [Ilumatobacter sp.]|uniref:pyridoxal-dependent decarboxylase n=1 Tax=Ilumatobacter sp. TaxID=1967498 RepID=UPI003296A35E